jgi:hypothetical protein
VIVPWVVIDVTDVGLSARVDRRISVERSADQTVQPEGVTDSSVPDIDLEVPLPIPGEGADLSLPVPSDSEHSTVSVDLMVREILEDYYLDGCLCWIRHFLLPSVQISMRTRQLRIKAIYAIVQQFPVTGSSV